MFIELYQKKSTKNIASAEFETKSPNCTFWYTHRVEYLEKEEKGPSDRSKSISTCHKTLKGNYFN